MFEEFVQILNDMGRSIHAYQRCATQAYDKAGTDPDHAAAYLMIAMAAESFVARNERMPITADDVQAAYERFSGHVSRLQEAYETSGTDARMAALNETATRIAAER
ncbi:hypothetical protein SAMN04490244_103205 [Tranquillimonas rosea]|uniref:Uncharacterized protein n=1 Tax=Tranquillimonas rosea TaxID=641238 RepID=A0A1H9SH81_9RHOB|nr:hypothetical protein [Tranquillimonas rosea]SER84258.1 hypothetical protein SAMN04490244_103205 [Tranquillimonas rosea]